MTLDFSGNRFNFTMMAELKKYTSFEALKLDEKPGKDGLLKDTFFSEFETFLKQLQSEYSNKKKANRKNGKQPNQ
jgi:hypothetical protein